MIQEPGNRKGAVLWGSHKQHTIGKRAVKEFQGILRPDCHENENLLIILHNHSVDQR